MDALHLPLISQPRLVLHHSAPDTWSKEPTLKTPSDFFAFKYPRLVDAFGPAFLEAHSLDPDGFLKVDVVDINIDLFAGIVGGTDSKTQVVFYLPEEQWYGFNPSVLHFKVVPEERLRFGLSQELIQCTRYLSQNRSSVHIAPIFQKFRSEEVLDAILEGLNFKNLDVHDAFVQTPVVKFSPTCT